MRQCLTAQKRHAVLLLLLLAGADPNVAGGDEESPLHLAAQAGHDGMMNTLLLKRGPIRAQRRAVKGSALHVAAAEGHALLDACPS